MHIRAMSTTEEEGYWIWKVELAQEQLGMSWRHSDRKQQDTLNASNRVTFSNDLKLISLILILMLACIPTYSSLWHNVSWGSVSFPFETISILIDVWDYCTSWQQFLSMSMGNVLDLYFSLYHFLGWRNFFHPIKWFTFIDQTFCFSQSCKQAILK